MHAVLDVAAGLVFLYLLLSLVVTSVSEMIAGVLSLRTRMLQSRLRKLPNDLDGNVLYGALLDHPLVKAADNLAGRHGAWR